MRIAFEGKRIDPGVYRINVPILKNILPSGKYNFEVNVLIDGKHFSPISESIELLEEVKPIVKMKEIEKNVEDVTIKVNESSINIKQTINPQNNKISLHRIGTLEK